MKSRKPKYQTKGETPTEEEIQMSRQEAIQGLIDQGLTDPEQILNFLNYDDNGQEVGDFTIEEIENYIGEEGEMSPEDMEEEEETEEEMPAEEEEEEEMMMRYGGVPRFQGVQSEVLVNPSMMGTLIPTTPIGYMPTGAYSTDTGVDVTTVPDAVPQKSNPPAFAFGKKYTQDQLREMRKGKKSGKSGLSKAITKTLRAIGVDSKPIPKITGMFGPCAGGVCKEEGGDVYGDMPMYNDGGTYQGFGWKPLQAKYGAILKTMAPGGDPAGDVSGFEYIRNQKMNPQEWAKFNESKGYKKVPYTTGTGETLPTYSPYPDYYDPSKYVTGQGTGYGGFRKIEDATKPTVNYANDPSYKPFVTYDYKAPVTERPQPRTPPPPRPKSLEEQGWRRLSDLEYQRNMDNPKQYGGLEYMTQGTGTPGVNAYYTRMKPSVPGMATRKSGGVTNKAKAYRDTESYTNYLRENFTNGIKEMATEALNIQNMKKLGMPVKDPLEDAVYEYGGMYPKYEANNSQVTTSNTSAPASSPFDQKQFNAWMDEYFKAHPEYIHARSRREYDDEYPYYHRRGIPAYYENYGNQPFGYGTGQFLSGFDPRGFRNFQAKNINLPFFKRSKVSFDYYGEPGVNYGTDISKGKGSSEYGDLSWLQPKNTSKQIEQTEEPKQRKKGLLATLKEKREERKKQKESNQQTQNTNTNISNQQNQRNVSMRTANKKSFYPTEQYDNYDYEPSYNYSNEPIVRPNSRLRKLQPYPDEPQYMHGGYHNNIRKYQGILSQFPQTPYGQQLQYYTNQANQTQFTPPTVVPAGMGDTGDMFYDPNAQPSPSSQYTTMPGNDPLGLGVNAGNPNDPNRQAIDPKGALKDEFSGMGMPKKASITESEFDAGKAVDSGLNALSSLTSWKEQYEQRQKEKEKETKHSAFDVAATIPQNAPGVRGDYQVNTGMARPNAYVVNPYQGMGNTQYIRYAQTGMEFFDQEEDYNPYDELGGEFTYMTDDEIEQFMRDGGELEFY